LSREPNIRIRNKDRSELAKLNKSFNAKAKRLQKEFGKTFDIEVKKIGDFQTRKEFNAYKNQMKDFTQYSSHRYVKNSEGVVLPYEAVKEAKDKVKEINKTKEKAWKKVQGKSFTDRGKETGLTVKGQKVLMGDTRYSGFNGLKFNIDRFRSEKEFKDYVAKLGTTYEGDFMQKKNEQYRDNFIDALNNVFGSSGDGIKKAVMDMDLQEFIEMSLKENFGNLNFIYDLTQQRLKLNALSGVFGIKKGA
jgi:hypothetical protein